jgi:DNA-binding IclR family transcriptional regulator
MSNGVETAAASTSAGLPVELQILELFHAHRATILGPTDVEKLTGISKGTASAKMKLLAEARYLTAQGQGRYSPGGKFFDMCVGWFAAVMRQNDAAQQLATANAELVRSAFGQLLNTFSQGGQA